MTDTEKRTEAPVGPAAPMPPPADARKPYEAPRLLKKRSVAQATLFTAKGPMATMITGNG